MSSRSVMKPTVLVVMNNLLRKYNTINRSISSTCIIDLYFPRNYTTTKRAMTTENLLVASASSYPTSISNELKNSSSTNSPVNSSSSRNGTSATKRELPPPITITPEAVARVKEILHGKESEFIGVKIGVKRRGCNGYSYTMNYASLEDQTSGKFEVIKVKGEDNLYVLVDKKAVFFLVGTSMHWEETELSSEFTFNNPNAKGSCGCGESFNV